MSVTSLPRMNTDQRGLKHFELTDKIIAELKAGRALEAACEEQLLNYLRATEIEVGLLLNFGQSAQFRRLAFDNERKKIRVDPREPAEEKLTEEK
jgi:PD-(D/E)XK nuclease superfamily